MHYPYEDMAGMIDHSLLHPTMTDKELRAGCHLAKKYKVASVCIKPYAVAMAAKLLKDSGVAVGAVVGFPHGGSTTAVKRYETLQSCKDGATEIDMVINIGALKGGEHDLVRRDIAGVSDACRDVGAPNKVIIEAAYLSDEEKVIACRLAVAGRAGYVKTSTGFGPGGATVFDVALMREVVGEKMGVKAAGGIHTADEVREMITAGATRIGASAGVRIVSGEEGASGGSY